MTVSSIVVAMLEPLLWLLPLMVAGVVLKSPWFKGWLGERKVRSLIRRHLDSAVYREFSNVTVRDEFGDTTQIDHVFVSPYGVFVLETKHMAHWIFGRRNQPSWTQQIYRKRISFQNPLRQNYRHVKVLASALGLPDEMFKSVVVFTGDCSFRTEMPEEVRTCANLIGYLRSFDTVVLASDQVQSLCGELERLRLAPSLRTLREHVENLRRRHGEVRPAADALPPRRMDSFVEAAGERLLRAAEDRIRYGGRHHAARVVRAGLWAILIKGVFAVMAMGLIWWILMTVVGNATRSVQRPQVVAAPAALPRPSPEALPAPRRPSEPAAAVAREDLQPVRPRLTAAEIAERQRQAEESMRILERSTPEIPLALPGSPVVGPPANATGP